MSDIPVIPAPWDLKGRGFIILYRFTKEEIVQDPFLSDHFKANFAGGFGSLMAVDYETSNAGPYQELLFIPGAFRFYGKKLQHISRIFVSTDESVVNGRRNWAIPKERANFVFQPLEKDREEILVEHNGDSVFRGTFRIKGPVFPVNTIVFPYRLVQVQNNHAYHTRFTGHGWGRLASVESVKVNPEHFPALAEKKPLIAIAVQPFSITFPTAVVEDIKG
ncbi:acetoacetate decarboxylase family protein [Gracilinema caldarium]|uniref:acetoacetate decarboxylase family protein n=1 Tax=Gracilinema caldarium TaxID=215591 RepID=UPI0026F35C49|nr:acetoacetate decarboxylase family protein [Gracilinema caldarium]